MYSGFQGDYIQELIRLPNKSHPGWSLDTTLGYPGYVTDTPQGPFTLTIGLETAPVGKYHTTVDAPFMQLSTQIDGYTTNYYYRNDHFYTTLMYRPPGSDSIPVPIKKFEWKWGGQAKLVGGQWQPGTNPDPQTYGAAPFQSVTPPVDTDAFPVWGHNITEFTTEPVTWININY